MFSPNKKAAENWGSATKQEEVASGKQFCPPLTVLHKGMNLQTLFVCVCVLSTCIPLSKEKMKMIKSRALLTEFLFFFSIMTKKL